MVDSARPSDQWLKPETLELGDIAIGAVEIKNSGDDTRAVVGANGLYVDLRNIASNVTLNPSPNFIGLVTVVQASPVTLAASSNYIGLATVIPAVPTSIVHGMVSSASGGVIQFEANAIKWAQIKAIGSNPTTIFLGGSSATINNGYALEPGETVGFSINNTNLLYLSNGYGTASLRYVGGN